MIVVVDTNIVFSALISPEGMISDLILNSAPKFQFVAPSYLVKELQRHSKKLQKASGFTSKELQALKSLLFRKLQLIQIDTVTTKTGCKQIISPKQSINSTSLL